MIKFTPVQNFKSC